MGDNPTHELVSELTGDLRAATASADVVERHLAIALAIDAALLQRVPKGQIVDLRAAAVHLEEAGLRLLGSINPRLTRTAMEIVDVARSEGVLTAHRASERGGSLRRGPLRVV